MTPGCLGALGASLALEGLPWWRALSLVVLVAVGGPTAKGQGWHLWPVLPLVLTSEGWACRSSLAFTSFLPRVGQLREIADVWSAGGQGLVSLKAGGAGVWVSCLRILMALPIVPAW